MRYFLSLVLVILFTVKAHSFAVKEEWDAFSPNEQRTYIRGYLEGTMSTFVEWKKPLWKCRMKHKISIEDFRILLNARWEESLKEFPNQMPHTPGMNLLVGWMNFCREKGYDIQVPQ